MEKMIYRNYDDCAQLLGTIPFSGLSGFTKKLIDGIINSCESDFWMWTKEQPIEKDRAEWQHKIAKMTGWLKSRGMELESLMSALETDDTAKQISQTKFNDTPDTIGDYAVDEHTSTISTSTSSGKLGTVEKVNLSSCNRLFDKLKNEFIKAFLIQEGSLEDE